MENSKSESSTGIPHITDFNVTFNNHPSIQQARSEDRRYASSKRYSSLDQEELDKLTQIHMPDNMEEEHEPRMFMAQENNLFNGFVEVEPPLFQSHFQMHGTKDMLGAPLVPYNYEANHGYQFNSSSPYMWSDTHKEPSRKSM